MNMKPNITSVSDMPLEKDLNDFGTKRYIDGLVEFIRYSVSPLTIALQGEWGSGKTSLMNRLEARLCSGESEFLSITINTWEYSMLSTPEETVIKIIERLVKELARGEKQQTAIDKFSKWAKVGGGIAFRAAREAAKIAGGIAGSILVEGIVGGGPDGKANSEEVSLSDLKETLEKSISEQIGNGKKGVLVFVDDLDRLNPPVAVEILELLKNIFSLQGCIFILAIDYEVVVKGLEPKFGKLNDKNEREFRSFFDKIIQVPFSLPVNNYQPGSFLLNMLRDINYISNKDDLTLKALSGKFTQIVDKTAGKNPRSIKRLINSLSLINCISKIPDDGLASKQPLISPDSSAGKIINFAVIALQISYPRIYNLLTHQPDFTQWNIETARRFKVADPEKIITEDNEENTWENVLSAICETDAYLRTRESDIKDVIEIISQEIRDNSQSAEAGKVLKEFLNRSSVTGVGGLRDSSEVDYSQIISRLHASVVATFTAKHKDWKFSGRRVTRNGGFNLFPNQRHLQSKLSPCELNNDRITLRLEVPSLIDVVNYPNIRRILDLGYVDAMNDLEFSKLIDSFDETITTLLNNDLNKEWFMGLTLRSRLENQWNNNGKWQNPKAVLLNTTFDFSLPTSTAFEQSEVGNAVCTIHEAVWNLHLNARKLK